MDVPAWARRAILDAVAVTFAELLDRWTAWVPPAVLSEFRREVAESRQRLVERIIEIITTEEEGPGGLYVLRIENSSSHEGLIKVTAIAAGGETHRFNRIRGDVPDCEITVLYQRTFQYRLRAEKFVHSRLRSTKHPKCSKYYRCAPELAIECIDATARVSR